MSTSETVTNIVKSFAIPWAEEMAYNEGYYDKGNEIGAWMMSIICAFVGIVYTYASFIIGKSKITHTLYTSILSIIIIIFIHVDWCSLLVY